MAGPDPLELLELLKLLELLDELAVDEELTDPPAELELTALELEVAAVAPPPLLDEELAEEELDACAAPLVFVVPTAEPQLTAAAVTPSTARTAPMETDRPMKTMLPKGNPAEAR